MKHIKLENGFELDLEDDVLDNMELVDALAEMKSDEDPIAVSKVITLLLGKDTKKALYDFVRTESGRVPVAEVSKMVTEIFGAFGDAGKN